LPGQEFIVHERDRLESLEFFSVGDLHQERCKPPGPEAGKDLLPVETGNRGIAHHSHLSARLQIGQKLTHTGQEPPADEDRVLPAGQIDANSFHA